MSSTGRCASVALEGEVVSVEEGVVAAERSARGSAGERPADTLAGFEGFGRVGRNEVSWEVMPDIGAMTKRGENSQNERGNGSRDGVGELEVLIGNKLM